MYLRQIEPGKGRDPTMTYVPDLAGIELGHWLRLPRVWVYVIALRDAGFVGVPCVIADTYRFSDTHTIPDDAVIHDLRDEAIETWRYGAITQNGEMPTREQARAMMERWRLDRPS